MQAGVARERTVAMLRDCVLWYSPASRFNDPFDCRFDVALRSSKEVEQMIGDGFDRGRGAIGAALSTFVAMMRKRSEAAGAGLQPPRETGLAAAAKTRDPFKVTIRQEDEQGRMRKRSAGGLFNDVQSKRMRRLHDLLDEAFGVLCLSERSDDLLLWSHYADGHRGVCIEFDVGAHADVFPCLHRVKYERTYPAISPGLPGLLESLRRKLGDDMPRMLLTLVDVLADDLHGEAAKSEENEPAVSVAGWFFVKSSHWKYEREWRCLKPKPGAVPFPPSAMSRIIVGCVDTEATLASVREAIVGTPLGQVPLYKAVRKGRRFGLNVVPAGA